MPASASVPPFFERPSAGGTNSPTGAKRIALSTFTGMSAALAPTQTAPICRANSRCFSSRVTT